MTPLQAAARRAVDAVSAYLQTHPGDASMPRMAELRRKAWTTTDDLRIELMGPDGTAELRAEFKDGAGTRFRQAENADGLMLWQHVITGDILPALPGTVMDHLQYRKLWRVADDG